MNLEIEFVRLCPYCGKRTKKRTATCGSWKCQWHHHILQMRKKRKTNRVHPTRRVI